MGEELGKKNQSTPSQMCAVISKKHLFRISLFKEHELNISYCDILKFFSDLFSHLDSNAHVKMVLLEFVVKRT